MNTDDMNIKSMLFDIRELLEEINKKIIPMSTEIDHELDRVIYQIENNVPEKK